tara:strand:+ start:346 stop:480 length:135 start_codon:yes stop_codon:yes gene_type:complete
LVEFVKFNEYEIIAIIDARKNENETATVPPEKYNNGIKKVIDNP